MKKVILTLCFAFIAIVSYAQNIDKGTDKKGNLCLKKGDKIVVKESFEKVSHYDAKAGLIPAKLNGKWGFYDNDGKLVIPHQYEGMMFQNPSALLDWYRQERMEVSLNGKKIFIDKTGKEVTAPEYDIVMETTHTGAGYFFKKNGKWALADKDKKVITEFKYDVIRGPIGVNPFVYKGTRDGQDFRLSAEGVEEEVIGGTPNSNTTQKAVNWKCSQCGEVKSSVDKPVSGSGGCRHVDKNGVKQNGSHKWVKQ